MAQMMKILCARRQTIQTLSMSVCFFVSSEMQILSTSIWFSQGLAAHIHTVAPPQRGGAENILFY